MPGGSGGEERWDVSRRTVLASALLFYLVVRLAPFPSVFRNGDVVLLGNDPYAYLHIVTEVVRGTVPVTTYAGFGIGEPLLVSTLAGGAWLLGGESATPFVLAVYPVLAGVVVALGTYVMAHLLTEDVRVGVTAVVVLAVTPLAVSRTALGFADHHAFDLLWVTLVATSLAWILGPSATAPRRRWAIGGLFGVSIGAQAMAWNASPLLLVPVGLALVAWSLTAVRNPGSWRDSGPLLFGLGSGAAFSGVFHLGLGWQSTLVASTPVGLFVGGVVLVGLLALVDSLGRSWPSLVAFELAAAIAGVVVLWLLAPAVVADVTSHASAVTEYFAVHETTTIGETTPITAEFGPVIGFVVLLGFAPVLGLPALAWAAWRGRHRTGSAWYVVAVFLGWFLGLAFIQRRFAVHLTPFLAVYAGLGFVVLADWLDLLRVSAPGDREFAADRLDSLRPPERERLAILAAMGVIGGGTSLLLSREILSRLEIDEAAYRAASWIRDYADTRDLAYPANYVLAAWGRVRMYNHFVNGRSRTYAYARATYGDFLQSHDPDEWYERFEDRVGFVVTSDLGDVSPVLTQGKLHDEYGSGRAYVDGVGHFRARWESGNGSLKVFEVLPGATVTGTGPADTELSMSTSVRVAPDGKQITYRRLVRTDANGAFSVTLAHPGQYEVADSSFTVPESAVLEGNSMSVDLD